jgi:hypothetical protein
MNNVITHPAFDRDPTAKCRHRRTYPKNVTSMHVYQRMCAELESGQAAEDLPAEMHRLLDEVSYHLVMAARAIARHPRNKTDHTKTNLRARLSRLRFLGAMACVRIALTVRTHNTPI